MNDWCVVFVGLPVVLTYCTSSLNCITAFLVILMIQSLHSGLFGVIHAPPVHRYVCLFVSQIYIQIVPFPRVSRHRQVQQGSRHLFIVYLMFALSNKWQMNFELAVGGRHSVTANTFANHILTHI